MIEAQYIKFLREVYLKSDGTHIKESTVGKYSYQTTKKIDLYLKKVMPESGYNSIYEINSIDELFRVQKALFNDPEFKAENEKGDNMYSAGLKKYILFAQGILISEYTTDTSVLDIKEPIPKHHLVKPSTKIDRDPLKITMAKGACKYCCQLNTNHLTFKSERDGNNYVEGHHIIPLKYQKYFDYSLDVLANIIVLCPNCHRLLHYAVKQERIDRLYKIYDERYSRFSNAGILQDRNIFVDMIIDDLDNHGQQNKRTTTY